MQNFHTRHLNHIKKSLGASYVAWERNKDEYRLKVVVSGNPLYFVIGGTPNDVTAENYSDFLKSFTNEE